MYSKEVGIPHSSAAAFWNPLDVEHALVMSVEQTCALYGTASLTQDERSKLPGVIPCSAPVLTSHLIHVGECDIYIFWILLKWRT